MISQDGLHATLTRTCGTVLVPWKEAVLFLIINLNQCN